jgi:hypothetical protein
MHALTRKGMSVAEMTTLLERREIDPDDVAAEVERLESVGLLDDSALAENLVRTLVPANAARLMPFSAAAGMLGISQATDTPETLAAGLSQAQNALLFGGYTVALLAIGTTLFYRRDVN